MSLDKRLKEISLDTDSEFGEFSRLSDSDIEAIKQAFIDEGWIETESDSIRTREVSMAELRADRRYQLQMTGPEWLARFEKELGDMKAYSITTIKQAARRAAGVDHE